MRRIRNRTAIAAAFMLLGLLLWLLWFGNGSDPRFPVSCSRLLTGDQRHIRQAEAHARSKPGDYRTDGEFADMPCSQLTAGYWTAPVSQSELGYPIAFTVLVHRDFYQVSKLMQAIHRSHNVYCLHVDAKAATNFTAAVRRLAGCFDNVELLESRVVWGESSVLLADLRCYRALLYGIRKWHYVINLTGQEYPIRTLHEMVRVLQLMNGSNNMEKLRTRAYLEYPPMPDNSSLSALRWYKGSAHAIISRAAVEYMIRDARARRILSHILHHYGPHRTVPDETFYATLNHNYALLQFPGSYTGSQFTTDRIYRQIYRYKIWSEQCRSGRSVHGICILGAADLQELNARPEFFANKFFYDFQADAFRCAQERFWINTLADYRLALRKTHDLPLSYYANLEFVKHHA